MKKANTLLPQSLCGFFYLIGGTIQDMQQFSAEIKVLLSKDIIEILDGQQGLRQSLSLLLFTYVIAVVFAFIRLMFIVRYFSLRINNIKVFFP